ncbi:hypothetical protein H4683_001602 [Filibacter limicola]|uniref:Uncharacterized protein n=1 Tax=Sporosarcina limicola TaxID=34101 RepID=A0A927MH50_9BACL|nr:hypothetical protein [Sporosarcina limicola]
MIVNGILALSLKGFDFHMLLHPFKERFNLPAITIKICNFLRGKIETACHNRNGIAISIFRLNNPQGVLHFVPIRFAASKNFGVLKSPAAVVFFLVTEKHFSPLPILATVHILSPQFQKKRL